MISHYFVRPVYIRVYKNRFSIQSADDDIAAEAFQATQAFSTDRLLVGHFSIAETLLKASMLNLWPKNLLSRTPAIIIQPMEMIEGGLCEVEERVLKELAFSAGAHKVVIWQGHELCNEEVLEQLNQN